MIQIQDKKFKEYLSTEQIDAGVTRLAEMIDKDYEGRDLIVLGILNGSFMFLSDLVKKMNIDPHISFVKLASYDGTSSGEMKSLIGLGESLEGKNILIVEDIVDTGNTLEHLLSVISQEVPKSIKVATMFYKPLAYQKERPIEYVGIEIENLFVVGYGMDYDGLGRNLTSLYQICP